MFFKSNHNRIWNRGLALLSLLPCTIPLSRIVVIDDNGHQTYVCVSHFFTTMLFSSGPLPHKKITKPTESPILHSSSHKPTLQSPRHQPRNQQKRIPRKGANHLGNPPASRSNRQNAGHTNNQQNQKLQTLLPFNSRPSKGSRSRCSQPRTRAGTANRDSHLGNPTSEPADRFW